MPALLIPRAGSADTFTWTTGNFVPGVTAPNPMTSPDVLEIKAGATKRFDATSWDNLSTVHWNADPITLQNGSTINNGALWEALSDSSLLNGGGAISTFNNTGHFLKSAGSGTTTISTIAFVNSGMIEAKTGVINFNGANAMFNTGTTFTGAGKNLITSNASFNGTINSSNLVLQSGTFTGNLALLNGTITWTGGSFTGSWELPAGQTLNAQTGNSRTYNNAAFTNKGTLNWQTTNSLLFQNGSNFDNQGTFNMVSGTSLTNNGGAISSFVNSGMLSVAAGQSSSVGTIAFVNNGGNIAVDGQLTFGGGNATFNGGTSFSGGGLVSITSNATFRDAFSSTNLALINLSFNGVPVTFTGDNAISSGSVKWGGGTITGVWDIGNGTWSAGTGTALAPKVLSSASFTNDGTFSWQTADSLLMQNGSTLLNRGLFEFRTGAGVGSGSSGGAVSTFDNRGTIRVAAGQNASIGGFDTSGAIRFVSNAGTIDAGAGGSFTFGGGNATINAGTQFTGAGATVVSSNAVFNGAFNSSNLSLRGGTYTGNDASINGNAELKAGTLTGSWTIAPGATLTAVSGNNKNLSNVTLTNQGTFVWNATSLNFLFFQNNAGLINEGTIDVRADTAFTYSNPPGAFTFINNGLLVKSAGTGTWTIVDGLGFDNRGVMDVRSGTINLPANFTNNGTLRGVGTFSMGQFGNSTLTNAGHVAPGESPGTLTVQGSYVQSAAGTFDVELESMLSSDQLLVIGKASLGGTLALSCYGNCAFAVGDEIVILDAAGPLAGTFSNVTKSGFGSGDFDVIYDPVQARVLLRVTEAATPAVPEPGPVLMTVLATVGCIGRRRRQRGLIFECSHEV